MYRVEEGADLFPWLEAGQTPRLIAPKKAKQPMRHVIFWLFVSVMNLRKIGDQDKKTTTAIPLSNILLCPRQRTRFWRVRICGVIVNLSCRGSILGAHPVRPMLFCSDCRDSIY